MTPPLIEMVEEYGTARAIGATGEPTAAEKADALLAEIRQRDMATTFKVRALEDENERLRARVVALEAEQRVGAVVVPDMRHSEKPINPDTPQKLWAESDDYYRFGWNACRAKVLEMNAATLTPARLAELEANERRCKSMLDAMRHAVTALAHAANENEIYEAAYRHLSDAIDAAIEAGAGEGRFSVVATPAGFEHLD